MDIKYFLLVSSLTFSAVTFAWDGSIGGVDGSISEADRAEKGMTSRDFHACKDSIMTIWYHKSGI